MTTRIKELFVKYKKAVSYVFFAVMTSLLHVGVFFVCYHLITENVIICNIAAYFVSILTSFIINKSVVFKCTGGNPVVQMLKYLLVKFVSFVIDSVVLLVLSDWLLMPVFWAKLIANCSTTINNYFFSNRFVFSSGTRAEKRETEERIGQGAEDASR